MFSKISPCFVSRRWTWVMPLFLIALSCAQEALALCAKWGVPQKVGELNSKVIDESSGLARSKQFEVFYHTNDSGTAPVFFVTKLDGSKEQVVKIRNFTPLDPEEIGLGPCPKTLSQSCVITADIGDNLMRRKSVALFFMEEQKSFPLEVTPTFIARFKYPGGPRNAEAMSVLDNGDVIIVTKEMSKLGKTGPAHVYRSTLADYVGANGEPVELKKIGEIDISFLTKQLGYGALVTAMSSLGNGKRFSLLTYAMGIEFEIDLTAEKLPSTSEMKEGIHYRLIPLALLPQQESLAYDKNGKDLFYTTEIMQRLLGFGSPAPLFKISCEQ